MAIDIDGRFVIPDRELSWRFQPSGGPGGQHANRAHTRVELTWHLGSSEVVPGYLVERLRDRLGTAVVVVVDDERSQARNRDLAVERLTKRVEAALAVPKRRRATKPSVSAKRRRMDSKAKNSRNKKLRRRPSRDD